MQRLLSLVAAAAWVGCGPRPAPADTGAPSIAPPASTDSSVTELSPALVPLAWWLGDWQGDEGREHWIAVDGTLYGIALQDRGMFEVMVVDDGPDAGPADGALRLIAMPGGGRAVEFLGERIGVRDATFANPAHDAPKRIGYERTPDGLRATLDAGERRQLVFRFRPGPRTAAPELVAADQARSAATAVRGADGWMDAMAPGAAMVAGGSRVEGDAMRTRIADHLAAGALRWTPIASGRHGRVGFTVGKATFTAHPPAPSWQATYATIWREQARGGWKAVFDVGRPVHPL